MSFKSFLSGFKEKIRAWMQARKEMKAIEREAFKEEEKELRKARGRAKARKRFNMKKTKKGYEELPQQQKNMIIGTPKYNILGVGGDKEKKSFDIIGGKKVGFKII
jgi:hypothetical protein